MVALVACFLPGFVPLISMEPAINKNSLCDVVGRTVVTRWGAYFKPEDFVRIPKHSLDLLQKIAINKIGVCCEASIETRGKIDDIQKKAEGNSKLFLKALLEAENTVESTSIAYLIPLITTEALLEALRDQQQEDAQ